jgi:thiamine-phosphate diphosphorylase
MVLTDPRPASGRPLADVVAACLAAGVRAIQLRDKAAPARDLVGAARGLLSLTTAAGALLLVNDRLDVALAAGADGVHLGPDDLPVAAARALAPPGFLIGHSTDDPERAASPALAGADYFGVGAVFGTRSKPGLADEAIGPERVAAVLRAAGRPCVGIGGIGVDNAPAVLATGAGVAVLSAVIHAPEPAVSARRLVELAAAAPPRQD